MKSFFLLLLKVKFTISLVEGLYTTTYDISELWFVATTPRHYACAKELPKFVGKHKPTYAE